MRALLKGFGWTIWGAIGAGLLIIAVFVGYQAALKLRDPRGPSVRDSHELPVVPDASDSHLGSALRNPSSPPVALSNIHRTFREAADQHDYDRALEYGLKIADQGTASAQDLRVIAQSYLALNDCSNAIVWFEKASDALRRRGQPEAETPPELMARCPAFARRPPITPEHRERILRLLATVQDRARTDRENLPKLEADAAASQSGEPYVKLGQLYYGFGEYEKAIVAIERGLEKGAIAHLEDAYICIGRSKVALKDFAGARAAFARLKEVPTISPRIAALWALYGETLTDNP